MAAPLLKTILPLSEMLSEPGSASGFPVTTGWSPALTIARSAGPGMCDEPSEHDQLGPRFQLFGPSM
jgi:hypothetical protein